MKTRYLFFFFLLFAIGTGTIPAQDEQNKGFGLAVKASTNGLGGDAVLQVTKKLTIRLGYEQLGITREVPFTEENIDYIANVDFRTGSASLLLDFYLAKYVFLTAGLGWNRFHADINGHASNPLQFGDIQIPAEKIGIFRFMVDPSLPISPYAGIGFGRTLGSEKRLGFAFELGGFYQGTPDITVFADGMLSPTSNPDHGHEARLEKQINQYMVYPVLRLNLSYKLIRF
jgi:opacity protein-like surface antigen